MASYGTVVGGHFMNATVSTNHKGELVLQQGFKRRKLNTDEVAEWDEVTSGAGSGASGAAGAVGKVVVGAVLPGVVGKMASAALDATINSTTRPPRTVRIDWADGKQSLLKLPEQLFTHLAVLLRDRQAAPPPAPIAPPPAPIAPPPAPIAPPPATQPDLIEQIAQLAILRDQGVLTEDEFAIKKAELLARL